jgi:chaperone required for assembly of F1-ATPase
MSTQGSDEMRTLLSDLYPLAGEEIDPVAMARKDLKAKLPRRFWTDVTLSEEAGGFGVLLDGRPARTPARKPLMVPDRQVALALQQEWQGLGEVIDPAEMPLTRLINSALDGVALTMDAVREDAARYAGSDLLCYRADHPDRLVALQDQQWTPLLDWARSTLKADLKITQGLMFLEQSEDALQAVRDVVQRYDEPLVLAALHMITVLTGSIILALALSHRHLTLAEVWALAHLDEDFQMEIWGQDEEALARRAAKWREAEVASLILAALSPDRP